MKFFYNFAISHPIGFLWKSIGVTTENRKTIIYRLTSEDTKSEPLRFRIID